MTGLDVRRLRVAAAGGLDVHEGTLHVAPGEIVAVIGPSRPATSMFLRAISGVVPVESGSVAVDGVDVSAHPAHSRARHGLGSVLDGRTVFAALTVAQNLRVAGLRRGEVARWVPSWFPELDPMIDRRAGLLSGGEQTLVALARGLARRPRVLLVDEIFTGLAPGYVDRVRVTLQRAATEAGTAVVMADQPVSVPDFVHRVSSIAEP